MMMDVSDLFARYYEVELRWLRSKVGNPDDAEDILAEAFTKVCSFQARNPEKTIRYPRTWLRTIVANCLTDHYRYWSRRPAIKDFDTDLAFDDFVDCWNVLADDGFDEDWIEQHDLVELIRPILEMADLPERERSILKLRLSGYRFPEIAQMLDITSPAAARSIYFRIRQTLSTLTDLPMSYFATGAV